MCTCIFKRTHCTVPGISNLYSSLKRPRSVFFFHGGGGWLGTNPSRNSYIFYLPSNFGFWNLLIPSSVLKFLTSPFVRTAIHWKHLFECGYFQGFYCCNNFKQLFLHVGIFTFQLLCKETTQTNSFQHLTSIQ